MATRSSDDQSDLPTAEYLRKRLRIEIHDARRRAELTQKAMASKLDWSVSKVVRIEQGGVAISPSDVRAMMSLFGESEERIQELVDLARQAREAKSWSEYDDILTPQYMELIGREAAASHILKYEPNTVPGLFQTPSYTEALFDALGESAETTHRRVEVRSLRQRILDLDPEEGPELNVVIGEVCLVRTVGDPEVMREQIEHLVDLSRHSRISLFVMPFSAGVRSAAVGAPFTILRFADDAEADSLYLEDALRRTAPFEDGELIAEHLRHFSRIEETAERSGSFEEHAWRVMSERYGVDGPG